MGELAEEYARRAARNPLRELHEHHRGTPGADAWVQAHRAHFQRGRERQAGSIAKLGEDLDPKTVRNIKLCLSSILSTAEEDGLIAANPAVNLGRKIARLLKSRKAQKNVDFLTQHETRISWIKAKEVFPRLHAFFMIACRACLLPWAFYRPQAG